MKRLLILGLLAVCTAISGYAYDFKVDGLCYNKLSDSTVELTWEAINTPYTGNIVIPSYVNYNGKKYDVVAIGKHAMVNVNSVGDSGVYGWSQNSKLSSVSLPSTILTIGYSAFYSCSGLTSITIPNSVTSIGSSAFAYCSGLTSVTIPNSVTSIGDLAFEGCFGLTSIKVESGNTKYDSRNNCNAIIETSSNTLMSGCRNTIIPNSVTNIGKSAFYYCSGLTSITIPNSVTSIGNYAFNGCTGLTSITIPNSVTSIGERAFISCSGLISITVSNGNNKYDSRNNCNAIIETSSNTLITGCKNTIIPNSVTSIGEDAFFWCRSLSSIMLPNSVTSIGDYAFYYCI